MDKVQASELFVTDSNGLGKSPNRERRKLEGQRHVGLGASVGFVPLTQNGRGLFITSTIVEEGYAATSPTSCPSTLSLEVARSQGIQWIHDCRLRSVIIHSSLRGSSRSLLSEQQRNIII